MAKKRVEKFRPAKSYDDAFEAFNDINNNNVPTYGFASLGNQSASTFRGFDTGFGRSSYDENLSWNADIDENNVQGSINEFRSEQQDGWDTTGAFFGRVGVKVGTEIAKTAAAIVGTVGGLAGNAIDLATGEDNHDFLEIAFNNDFIKAAEKIQKYVQDEYLPVYVSDTVTNGGFLDKVSSGEFWATEGADGVGYLISAMAPGAAFKALGGANKIFEGIAKATALRYGKSIEVARKALTNAGMTTSKIDSYMIPAFNTYFEAGAEAKGAGDSMDSRKPEFIENFKSKLDIGSRDFQIKALEKGKELDEQLERGEISIDEYNQLGQQLSEIVANELAESAFLEQKGRAMRNTFLTNVGILAVPNYIQAKLVFGKNPSKVLIDKITGKATEATVKNTVKQGLKRTGQAFLSEGSEEVGQTSTEHRNVERGLNNELSEYAIQDLNPVKFGEDFIKSLGTTEGQVAGFLGGILGSPISIVQGYRQDKADRKNTERLREKINGQSTALNDIYNTPIYEQEEYTNPETGETIIRDKEVDGEKVMIPENVAKIKKALDLSEQLSTIYDEAVNSGDIETLEALKKQGEFNIITNFIGEDVVTLDALNEHLNTIFPTIEKNEDGSDLTQEQIKQNKNNKERVSNMISKAKSLQKDLVSFKDMTTSIIRLNNKEASPKQIEDFLNNLGNAFLSERAEEYDTKEKLDKLEKARNEILKDIELKTPRFFDSDYKTSEEIAKIKELKEANKQNKEIDVDENGFAFLTGNEIYQNNPRLNYLNEQIKKQKDKLKDFNETTNDLIWNNEFLNKQLNSKIAEENKIKEAVSPENVSKIDEFITKINDLNLVEEKELDKLIKDNPEYKDNPVVKAKIDQKRQEIIDTKKAIMDAAKAAKHAENIEKEETTPSNGQVPTVSNSNDKLDPSTESIQGNDTVEVGEFGEYVVVPAEDFEVVPDNTISQRGAKLISTDQNTGKVFDNLEEFAKYEKVPRDKTKDKVVFDFGDLSNSQLELINKLKSEGKLSPEETKLLEDYLPIKVTLSNGETSASSYIGSVTKNRLEYRNDKGVNTSMEQFNQEDLPLRKAIVKALIDNKGNFEDIEGSVEKQFPGRLKISDNTRNSIFDLDVFKQFTEEKDKIKYFQNNTGYYNTKGEFLPAKENNDLKGSEPNLSLIDGKKHKGELFLRIPMNNGKDFWLKLNSNKISEEKGKALFNLMFAKLNLSGEALLEDLKLEGSAFLNNFKDEIALIKSSEPLRLGQTIDKLIDLIIFNGNKNVKTEFKIDFESNKVKVGTLFNKLNPNITQGEFTALELQDRYEEMLEAFTNFFSYKRHNILFSNGATANFGNSNYIKYLLNEQDPILTTNAVVDEPTFGGYSNIYLNQNITNKGKTINPNTEIKTEVKTNIEIVTEVKQESKVELPKTVEVEKVTENNRDSIIKELNDLKYSNPREYAKKLTNIVKTQSVDMESSIIKKEPLETIIDLVIKSNINSEGKTTKKDCK